MAHTQNSLTTKTNHYRNDRETAACYRGLLTAIIWFSELVFGLGAHGNKMFTDNSTNKKYALWHFSGCLGVCVCVRVCIK